MSWLKKARRLKGISAQELANRIGVSLSYIQRIENGSRRFEGEIREKLCSELGFTPEDIAFDTSVLLEQLEAIAAEYGDNKFCSMSYRVIDGITYCTDVNPIDDLQQALDDPNTNLIRIRYARNNLTAQKILYDGN